MFVAGAAVGAAAMAGAYFLHRSLSAERAPPVAAAKPAADSAARTQSGVVLLPGETLVAPAPDVAAPAPDIAKPAPAPEAQAAAKARSAPAPTTPRYTKPAPPPALAQAPGSPPASPRYSREERRDPAGRSVCVNCGVVTSVTQGDYDWEVRVRLDDGSRRTLRYYDRPRVQVGDTFHIEDGRIIPD